MTHLFRVLQQNRRKIAARPPLPLPPLPPPRPWPGRWRKGAGRKRASLGFGPKKPNAPAGPCDICQPKAGSFGIRPGTMATVLGFCLFHLVASCNMTSSAIIIIIYVCCCNPADHLRIPVFGTAGPVRCLEPTAPRRLARLELRLIGCP